MIAVALDVMKVLLLLVPAALCLARPETVREVALEAGRRHGLDRAWQEGLLTDEFLWSIRICGAILGVLAVLLALALW